ncbi:MAG: protein serine/threonine phosphatase 2C family protein [Parachlamydiales bacterium]|nr:protein serine/threonine phosphatase 2C family protein [Parachlamydiales bacterium]
MFVVATFNRVDHSIRNVILWCDVASLISGILFFSAAKCLQKIAPSIGKRHEKQLLAAFKQQSKQKPLSIYSNLSYLDSLDQRIEVNSYTVNDHLVSVAYSKGEKSSPISINEDRYICQTLTLKNDLDIGLCGIFDGHGGPTIAEFLRQTLPKYIIEELNRSHILTIEVTDRALRRVFLKLEKEIESKNFLDCGSTATVALFFNKQLVIAHLGDSRAIWISADGETLQLTADMDITKKEAKKVKKLGGIVYENRIFSYQENGQPTGKGINISGSFGDLNLLGKPNIHGHKPYLINKTPAITSYPLKKGYLLLASDGLFHTINKKNEISTCQTGQMIASFGPIPIDQMAKQLIHLARNAQSTDDITCLIVKI